MTDDELKALGFTVGETVYMELAVAQDGTKSFVLCEDQSPPQGEPFGRVTAITNNVLTIESSNRTDAPQERDDGPKCDWCADRGIDSPTVDIGVAECGFWRLLAHIWLCKKR